MARSLIALWITLIAAIGTLGVMAQFWISQRENDASDRVSAILLSQLAPVNQSIGAVVDEYSFAIQRQINGRSLQSPSDCVDITRSPYVKSLVVANAKRELEYPSSIGNLSSDGVMLLEEALQLILEEISPLTSGQAQMFRGDTSQSNQMLNNQLPSQQIATGNEDYAQTAEPANQSYQSRVFRGNLRSQTSRSQEANYQSLDQAELDGLPLQTDNLLPQLDRSQALQQDSSPGVDSLEMSGAAEAEDESQFGWITWYHRRNLVLAYWWRDEQDWTGMVVLPAARWMADLVAVLPEERPASKTQGSSLPFEGGRLNQLVDIEGTVVYQWGDAAESEWKQLRTRTPSAELAVANPLEGWRLQVFASTGLERELAGDSLLIPIWLAVGGISLALLLAGLLATMTLNRTMHLARTRVSFVNHVSHELRTPLTNICMYADLLAGDIDSDANTQQLGRVAVIQNESRRLNRLINNVLQFARSGVREKPLQLAACNLDALVAEVLETFRPSLEELEFELETDLNTPENRMFDRGAVEQILVNLIGNAEKYAVSGRYLKITTKCIQDSVVIEILDRGPGVPAKLSKRIFVPFERASDRLADPAGTGIGLPISRTLCRKHGGDCKLVSSQVGALFRCTLKAPLAKD